MLSDRFMIRDEQWAWMEPRCWGKRAIRVAVAVTPEHLWKAYCGLLAPGLRGVTYLQNLANGIPFPNKRINLAAAANVRKRRALLVC